MAVKIDVDTTIHILNTVTSVIDTGDPVVIAV
jgi:hypothetical protein